MPTIDQVSEKIKGFLERGVGEWGTICLVLLLGLSSFGLGRLSALEVTRPAVRVAQSETALAPQKLQAGGLIVASRTGTVYYFPWCSGAQTIAPEREVWFPDEAHALQAGYRPSKTCQGLTGG